MILNFVVLLFVVSFKLFSCCNIPDLASIVDKNEPELKFIDELKRVKDPIYFFRALSVDLLIKKRFVKFLRPVSKYLIKFYLDELPKLNHPDALLLKETFDKLVKFLIKTGNHDIYVDLQCLPGKEISRIFQFGPDDERTIFHYISTKYMIKNNLSSMQKSFSEYENVKYLAHKLVNRTTNSIMLNIGGNLSSNDFISLVEILTQLPGIPVSEYEYFYAEINQIINLISDTDGEIVGKCILFNLARFGPRNSDFGLIDLLNDKYLLFDLAFRASLSNKMELLFSLLETSNPEFLINYLREKFKTCDNHFELFRFLVQVYNKTQFEAVKQFMLSDVTFLTKLFENYTCSSFEYCGTTFKFVMVTDLESLETSFTRNVKIELEGLHHNIKFKNVEVYYNFLKSSSTTSFAFEPNCSNLKLLLDNPEYLNLLESETNVSIILNSRCIEEVLDHENVLLLSPLLNFLLPKETFLSIQSESHYDTLAKLYEWPIKEIVSYLMKSNNWVFPDYNNLYDYFALRSALLYCLNRNEFNEISFESSSRGKIILNLFTEEFL